MAEREPEAAKLARAAMGASRAALAAGQTETALRWLDRAHRLLPRDPNIALALAGATLHRQPARSVHLFASVTQEHDVRSGWLGLAVALMRLGSVDQARDALAQALSRHVPHADTRSVANETIRATGDPGWCGLTLGGGIVLHMTARETPRIALDGLVLAGSRLPGSWINATRLTVTVAGRHLLGSPIDIGAIRRVQGIVTADRGGLRGWAWHPADPGRPVRLRITDDCNRAIEATAKDASIVVPDLGPLARPLGFAIPAAALHRLGTTLHVAPWDGPPLYGSPLSPLAELRSAMETARDLARRYKVAAAAPRSRDMPPMHPLPADLPIPDRPVGADRRSRSVSVIIPVHGQRELTLACLDTVLDSVAAPTRVIVVDDASPDPELVAALDALARDRRITLLRNERNRGFAASVNLGLQAIRGRDVVMLNSDTLVPPRWLERLRDAAHSAPDIGTVTPLSNDASILSYPDPSGGNPAPDRTGTNQLDALARAAGGSAMVDIPVGVGFCLYVRRDCLNAVGALREDIFAQGYGEENDFCLRARRLGWRNVALPSLFVAHRGGRSFNAAGTHLRARNTVLLERLHPGYNALVQEHARADPLAEFRRRLDQRRWRAARPRGQASAILITHDDAGGVEQRIRQSAADHAAADRAPIILRPARLPDGTLAVEASFPGGSPTPGSPSSAFPNLRFAMPAELPMLLRWLRGQHPAMTEVHHFLGHHAAMRALPAALGVPYRVHVHDYSWFCPRVALVDGHGRYCGEPDTTACQACIADHGRLDLDDTPVAALRDRSAALLAMAEQVIVPSNDAASRITRHFPGIRPRVVPHQDDPSIPHRLARPRPAHRRAKVCVLGAIGVHKGYQVLLACARDAAERNLDLEFVVVGTTIDDNRLLETGRVFVTGSYEPAQAVDLVLRQDADLGFLPSIAPETWCMGLTELWHAGLRVAAFDIGAPAERIRNTGRGFLLPPHLPPGAINNALGSLVATSDARGASSGAQIVPTADPSHPAAKGP